MRERQRAEARLAPPQALPHRKDTQHQQVLEEFAGPSGLPSSSSSSANVSSLLARVRTPSSSLRWACSTSSVSRVKDWGTKGTG